MHHIRTHIWCFIYAIHINLLKSFIYIGDELVDAELVMMMSVFYDIVVFVVKSRERRRMLRTIYTQKRKKKKKKTNGDDHLCLWFNPGTSTLYVRHIFG